MQQTRARMLAATQPTGKTAFAAHAAEVVRERADQLAEQAREHPQTSKPQVTIHTVDLNGETPVALRDSRTRYDLAIDFTWPAKDIASALQSLIQDGIDSGRWVRTDTREHHEPAEGLPIPVQQAEAAIRTAMRARLDGLTTNPHGDGDHLVDVIVDEQARHLAKPDVGGFPLEKARAAEAFSLTHSAMNRALALSSDPAETVRSLRAMLNMLAREVGA